MRAHWRNCFAAVDPDNDGSVMLRIAEEAYPLTLTDLGRSAKTVALELSSGPIVLVIESQYGHNNLMSAFQTARRVGAFAGMVAAYADARVEVVLVAPGTWQAWLRKATGSKAKKRADLKPLAEKQVPEIIKAKLGYRGASVPQRQGIADAWCISEYWRS